MESLWSSLQDCSFYVLLHFISLRTFIRNILENRSDSSPRTVPRHSWDLLTVQSAIFEKLPSYKEAKVQRKLGECLNSKIFWIISHNLLTINSFIIYLFRKLPSCNCLLMRNLDKSSFAVNLVCLFVFRVQWRFHIFQVILITTQGT